MPNPGEAAALNKPAILPPPPDGARGEDQPLTVPTAPASQSWLPGGGAEGSPPEFAPRVSSPQHPAGSCSAASCQDSLGAAPGLGTLPSLGPEGLGP